jgi:ATP-dependent DNA ligase
VWAFDLLMLNRKDLRKWSLEARQGRLQVLVSRFGCPSVLASEPFEGVVSKRRGAPYRSGACRGWVKIKTVG